MLHDAIERNQADGIAVCEAHEDLEVFRIRFGKALNFEFHEDNYGGVSPSIRTRLTLQASSASRVSARADRSWTSSVRSTS